jgi:hypothetical protein
MKKALATITLALASLTMFGQGRVAFNNVSGAADATVAVTIINNPAQAHPGEGAAGAYVGSDYSVQLLWAPQAAYADEASFLAAVVGSSGAIPFIGATGGGPTVDGAGLFDAGTVPNPVGTTMPAGAYTMQAQAWYNGGQYGTYTAAKNAVVNIGQGSMFNMTATAFPSTINTTPITAFSVATVPEPTTFALAGLGAAALMFARRRNK